MCVDPDWGLGLAVVVALYIYRNNRKLQAALTASQEAREALRLSEERHRFLTDNVSDVIWTMDLHGRNTYVSPSVERMRGYTVAEAMQQTIDEALTPASAKIAQAGVARDISERKRTELDLQIAARRRHSDRCPQGHLAREPCLQPDLRLRTPRGHR